MARKELVILDTDILIEIIRMNTAVIQKCRHIGNDKLAISSVSYSEFLVGSRDKEEMERYIKFMKKFKIIPVTRNIDDLFRKSYRTFAISHRPGIPDMLIAATALYYNHSVFTHNKRHFRFVPGIRLI